MIQYSRINKLYDRAIAELRNPPKGPGLPWMPKFTEFIGGLRPHEVTLLCAPTGTGKTELLASIAAQLALAEVPLFAAPVETGDVDFTSRVISTVAKRTLNHGVMTERDVMDEIENKHRPTTIALPLYIAHYDNRVSVTEMTNVLEWSQKNDGIRVALLDNLNFFLEVKKSSDMILEMDNAVHELVMFAKKIPIHTILVVHPRKTDGGRVESEFDIKGSSTAVQECANILLFNRPTDKHIESGRSQNQRELVFKKIRKRGYYVNRSIWISYQNGHYSEIEPTEVPRSHGQGQRYVPAGSD